MNTELASLLNPSTPLLQQGGDLFHLGHCSVQVVSSPQQVPGALGVLRASLGPERWVAIDLEWRPEVKGRQSTGVALLQLATAGVCLLVRTCRVPLCPSLRGFLSDPTLSLLGFGWNGADERMMRLSFGVGRADFGGCFQDLRATAESLGYLNQGMSKLAASVLGVALDKGRQVAISNWEAARLSHDQIKYAALDVLASYQIFSQLWEWHTHPARAPTCQQCMRQLGQVVSPRWRCLTCALCFPHIGAMEGHARKAKHDTGLRQCGGCGRALVLEPPAQAVGASPWGQVGEEEAAALEQAEQAAGVQFC